MGNTASDALPSWEAVSKEERRGLEESYPQASSSEGFSRLFALSRFGFASGSGLEASHLASSLRTVFLGITSSSHTHLDLRSLPQYLQLFLKVKSSPRTRLTFYWRLFPSIEMFLRATLSLASSEQEPTSELDVDLSHLTLLRWLQADEETLGSALLGLEGSEREERRLLYFLERRAPRLLAFWDQWLLHALTGSSLGCGMTVEDLAEAPSYTTQWLLNVALPLQLSYITEQELMTKRRDRLIDVLSSTPDSAHTTWDLIYCTDRDGGSMKRFGEAVYGYPAATLLLVEDCSGSIFGGFVPLPWPHFENKFFGDDRSFLFSASPTPLSIFSTRGVSANYVRYPDKERRNEPQVGIGFGGQSFRERLWLDGADNFVRGTKYEMCSTYLKGFLGSDDSEEAFTIKRMQLWGFGGAAALQAREDVRIRENKFTERNKKVDKSAIFGTGQSITENPDKMMMDWMSTKRTQ